MTPSPLLSLKNVTVSYDGKEALNCKELTVLPGDFIGIIGPNGGGKTTLVRAILQTVPYSGTITFGESLTHNGRKKIGYLPQLHDIDKSFPISVFEVVLSGLQGGKGLFSRYTAKDRKKAAELIDFAGIAALANQPAGVLSGGEFQRVMLCRALISDPKLLILDEPTNFVDSRFESELYHMLAELNKQITIVMVSHDLGTISTYIKSIVCVNRTVHHHPSSRITPGQLLAYNCPIQLVSHGDVPHVVLPKHD